MHLMKYALALILLASPAFADEPTVTLTQAELNAFASAVQAHALAQLADTQAKGAFDKVNAAFAAKPASPPAPTKAAP